jgi:hypothetical protein
VERRPLGERPLHDRCIIGRRRHGRPAFDEQFVNVIEVAGRDLLDKRNALGQVVQLGQGGVTSILPVLVNLITHATEVRCQIAGHVSFDTLPVALELRQDQLRDEQRQAFFVDQDSDSDDELLTIDVFGKVQPDVRVSEHIKHRLQPSRRDSPHEQPHRAGDQAEGDGRKAASQCLRSPTRMPQTPETSRLKPGSSRAAVEQPMSESNRDVAASSRADCVAPGAMRRRSRLRGRPQESQPRDAAAASGGRREARRGVAHG